MGYTTDFYGCLDITPPLNEAQVEYIQNFNDTRRIKRDASLTEQREDKVREDVGLPIGLDGGYFVGAEGYAGQETNTEAADVVNHNSPPEDQPGLWCQWTVTDDGKTLEWDQGEKFYEYGEWLHYLIHHFFKRWGSTLNGEIEFRGENERDRGVIYVKDNMVELVYDEVTNAGPSWER